MNDTPWSPGNSEEERRSRQEAYERLAGAARRVGVSIEKLHRMLQRVAGNEVETRRFLAEEVYHVPDTLLDELMRVRLEDLEKEDREGEDR
jgi:hypothetical protein